MPDESYFQFPAVVHRASAADLLAVARDRAPDPAAFDEHTPHFWRATISTNQLDAYYTAMQGSTLRNFASEAEVGVAFQDSHKTDGLVRMLGQSLSGKYTGPGGDGIAHTDADFYTLLGVSPTIDEFVTRMRGGLVRDVSVGFYGGQWMCSICGRDMMSDWQCYHWPGMEYVVTDEQGNKTDKKVLCTARVENAHLSEVSAVYDGATPGAMILRAQHAIDAGRLRPEQVRMLEVQYRTRLPGASHIVPGHDVKEPSMAPTSLTVRLEDLPSEQVRALLEPLGISADTLTDGLRQLAERDQTREAELERLRPLATEGEAYRKSRQDRAWAEYVRFSAAKGVAIPPDAEAQKRAVWERMALADLDAMADGYEEYATAKLGGGRQTVDESERDAETDPARVAARVPDAAFRTR